MKNQIRAFGDVFTSPLIVKYILDLVGYVANVNLSKIQIIEPSCGEGAFVIEILERLKQSSETYSFSFKQAVKENVICFDTDSAKINICVQRLKDNNINVPISIFRNESYLNATMPLVDVIVGNPPYIRHERIDPEEKDLYRKLFQTFRYRSDLYIPFYEKSLLQLKENGKHCFICSNRWLKNQYGTKLRELISDDFTFHKLINMERTNPFDDSVNAYPAITLISKITPSDQKVVEYACIDNLSEIPAIKFSKKPYNSKDWSTIFLDNCNMNNLQTITELGFSVGIGIATGADDIFINKNLISVVEEELLIPIITTKDLTDHDISWKGNFLFNPFDDKGEVIDLSLYPRAYSYLISQKEKLQNRYIAKKNPQFWYRTIDKVKVDLTTSPKIILPDISANKYIKIDYGQFYPSHNLYYIKSDSIDNLKVLSSLLMTEFVSKQLSAFSNSMNGGYPRWQSQYIKKLKLPNIHDWDTHTHQRIIQMYDNRDIQGINTLLHAIL